MNYTSTGIKHYLDTGSGYVDKGLIPYDINEQASGESGITAGTDITLSNVYLRKTGKLVLFRCNVAISSTIAGNLNVIATLPDGFRPSDSEILFSAWSKYNNATGFNTFGIVGSNGQLRTRTGSSTFSGNAYIDVAYYTA